MSTVLVFSGCSGVGETGREGCGIVRKGAEVSRSTISMPECDRVMAAGGGEGRSETGDAKVEFEPDTEERAPPTSASDRAPKERSGSNPPFFPFLDASFSSPAEENDPMEPARLGPPRLMNDGRPPDEPKPFDPAALKVSSLSVRIEIPTVLETVRMADR